MNDFTRHDFLSAPPLEDGNDPDPQESAEWHEAFAALLATQGPVRARQMLDALARQARAARIGWQPELATPYLNTIAVDEQPVFPRNHDPDEHSQR